MDRGCRRKSRWNRWANICEQAWPAHAQDRCGIAGRVGVGRCGRSTERRLRLNAGRSRLGRLFCGPSRHKATHGFSVQPKDFEPYSPPVGAGLPAKALDQATVATLRGSCSAAQPSTERGSTTATTAPLSSTATSSHNSVTALMSWLMNR